MHAFGLRRCSFSSCKASSHLKLGIFGADSYYDKNGEDDENHNCCEDSSKSDSFVTYDKATFFVPRGNGVFDQPTVGLDESKKGNNWNSCSKTAPPDLEAT